MLESRVNYRTEAAHREMDTEGMVKVRTAVLSVSDKTGLVGFAKELAGFGVELLATGGTFAELAKGGVRARDLQEDLKLPTAVSGSVKTLHAPLHAAILARDTPEHAAELKAMGVKPVFGPGTDDDLSSVGQVIT